MKRREGCVDMEVILVRHGIAEDKDLRDDDLKRQLTDKGKEEVEQLMPKLMRKLEDKDKDSILIWSSPANRALETAHIISSEFEIEQSTVHDFIYDGDFHSFSKELSKELSNNTKETTIFVVGHQPSLGQWYTQLTGDIVKIKKGMFLSVDVQSVTPIVANPKWTLRP